MERSESKKLLNKIWKIVLPLILGAAILVWTYKGFDFERVYSVLSGGVNYWWMLFSLVFGVLGHLFRGWRWNLSLAPLGEHPKLSNSVYAIFVSYAANLVIPRVGEVSRCGILAKYDGVSFSKSLGTVVTERIIDSLCVVAITGFTLLLQSGVFARFIKETGTDSSFVFHLFTSTNFYITIICIIALVVLAFFMFSKLSIFVRVKGILNDIWMGCMSLRHVENMSLFIFYTLGIWLCYFLQFYVTFFSFDFSSDLGLMAGLVMFVVGSIAVIVPTPNGAGPWHFAIITMMMMYGISKDDAGIFALLVHGIQTFLLILLGIYGLVALPLTNKQYKTKNS
ncbi:lysylphosphatidylglycerol synthase transmembrane domain-containing protein [uncultured Bacteroides sp.]|uniref:lysylphosphatidylglycerol synthase transmembrane domain-containing protein n=1 Tax=uncultured Bacteroides sp. TaxID=162156 RepID=UPI00262A3E7B|nr:lysylphosphatidylglycerol synthase transmembrane domain-containing protein [uncultured Bacteroides sp.]